MQILTTMSSCAYVIFRYRKAQHLWQYPQWDLHASDSCYAFQRGATVVVMTNVGAGKGISCEFQLEDGGPLPQGGRLHNMLEPQVRSGNLLGLRFFYACDGRVCWW